MSSRKRMVKEESFELNQAIALAKRDLETAKKPYCDSVKEFCACAKSYRRALAKFNRSNRKKVVNDYEIQEQMFKICEKDLLLRYADLDTALDRFVTNYV